MTESFSIQELEILRQAMIEEPVVFGDSEGEYKTLLRKIEKLIEAARQ